MKKKILVVDEDEDIRDLYSFLLEKTEKYDVKIACDGEEAITVFEEFHPHLILLDVMMPKMDGLQVLKILRQTNPDVIIVLNTAYADVKKDFTSWTAHAIVEKTLLPSEVLATIARLFDEAENDLL